MVKLTLGVKNNILMIFVPESLQQDHLYSFSSRLFEELIAKIKLYDSRAQQGSTQCCAALAALGVAPVLRIK